MNSLRLSSCLLIAVFAMACGGDVTSPVVPSSTSMAPSAPSDTASPAFVLEVTGGDGSANDPIRIDVKNGFVLGGRPGRSSEFNIHGNKGFKYVGTTESYPFLAAVVPVEPGATYDLALDAFGNVGTFTYKGADQSIQFGDALGPLEFSTPTFTVPSVMQSSLQFSVPFTMQGSFGFNRSTNPPESMYFELTGSGIAEVHLERYPEPQDSYLVTEIRYTFTSSPNGRPAR